MTLILASIRPHDVVITADGRSETVDNGKVTRIDDRYQKLFPVPDHPVVIAHLGENVLNGSPVKQFIARFIQRLNAGDFTIQEISDRLRNEAHPVVRERFRELGNPQFSVNFWVAGFSYHEAEPSATEVFWEWKDDVLYTEERRFKPYQVIAGGSGKTQTDAVDWHHVEKKSIAEVRAYHEALMQKAIHAPVADNPVGGKVHELVITPEKWSWTQAPVSSATRPATTLGTPRS